MAPSPGTSKTRYAEPLSLDRDPGPAHEMKRDQNRWVNSPVGSALLLTCLFGSGRIQVGFVCQRKILQHDGISHNKIREPVEPDRPSNLHSVPENATLCRPAEGHSSAAASSVSSAAATSPVSSVSSEVVIPTASKTLACSCIASSGFSRRKRFEFSRPWPS